MDTTIATSRALLQQPDQYPKANSCSGFLCIMFNIMVVIVIFLVVLLILAYSLFKKIRYNIAVRRGNVPAKLILTAYPWGVKPDERGELAAFTFPVHRPTEREEVNEESCPICLKERPKASSWIIFYGCKHATCDGCFRQLANQQRLNAACPMCRSLLAQGEGDRGGPKKVVAADTSTTSTTTSQSTDQQSEEAPSPAAPPAPLQPSDNNV